LTAPLAAPENIGMTDPNSTYQNPLAERYASQEMLENFSANRRYRTWRELWIALAESEAELGLSISSAQIEEMRRNVGRIDYARVAEVEKNLRHDVMAHITAFGEQCPLAKPIIHLGATSCYVTDNTDLILMRRGLELLRDKLVTLLAGFRSFALTWKGLPTLAYTHLQPAQLTTVGKRAAMWAQDFLLDLEDLNGRLEGLRFRGVKGTTGTQASFLELFDGDAAKVEALDRSVSQKMGFPRVFRITGQTYTRKVDDQLMQVLSGIAQSAHKCSSDARLLQSFGELEEPFETHQVGSSAMPYKRNPMRLERVGSLAKLVICAAQNPAWIHATQWLERTLDDSANRRISIPEAFLATDAMLIILNNVVSRLEVHPEVIRRRVQDELPFMLSESLLMLATREGGDRQVLHECIRGHAMEVAAARRTEGARNDLLDRLAADPLFARVRTRIAQLADPAQHVGRAPEQVEVFFRDEVDPVLARYPSAQSPSTPELRV
jgi:adenylosuccinate lyase